MARVIATAATVEFFFIHKDPQACPCPPIYDGNSWLCATCVAFDSARLPPRDPSLLPQLSYTLYFTLILIVVLVNGG